MSKAFETRNVVVYCYGNDVLKNLLPHLLEQLEVCQKALSGYLDQKRAAFPRFYFVSDANLLEVLSQSSNPAAIQPHLQSVFASVVRMGFDPANKVERPRAQRALGCRPEPVSGRTHATPLKRPHQALVVLPLHPPPIARPSESHCRALRHVWRDDQAAEAGGDG